MLDVISPKLEEDTLRKLPHYSDGNPETVAMFEYWLEEARKGDIYFGAVAVVRDKDEVAYDYAGAFGLEEQVVIPIRTLHQELDAVQKARFLSPRDYNLSASYVEYPLDSTPICWDFLIWLIDSEMTRIRLGGPPPLRVAFTREDKIKTQADFTMYYNVMQPLLHLIGAVQDQHAVGGRHKPMYVPFDIVLNARAGEAVPRLRASDKRRHIVSNWLHGTAPITITLREAPYYPQRNSNMEAWLKFAGDLKAKGEEVIFIRDTWKATEPLPGFATAPMVSWNVDLRMALYEQAKMNFFVSNGPGGLAMFGDRPYIYFTMTRENDISYSPFMNCWWENSMGMRPGDDWPWALPTQRLVWGVDSYEAICEAWEQTDHRAAHPVSASS